MLAPGDPETPGVPPPDRLLDGEGEPDSDFDGDFEPELEGEPDLLADGDPDCWDGDPDWGEGEPDCGEGEPDCDIGGGLPEPPVGVGGTCGGWLRKIRIAISTASTASNSINSQDIKIVTQPARS